MHNMLCLVCDEGYSNYACRLQNLILDSPQFERLFGIKLDEKSELSKNFKGWYENYVKYYDLFAALTKKMLAGEELLPPGKWNIDDFEGSVPPEYNDLIL